MDSLAGQPIPDEVTHVKNEGSFRTKQHSVIAGNFQDQMLLKLHLFYFLNFMLIKTIYLLLSGCRALGSMLCRIPLFSSHKKFMRGTLLLFDTNTKCKRV